MEKKVEFEILYRHLGAGAEKMWEKFSEDCVTVEMRTLRLLNTSHKPSFLFMQLNAH
jgi:hypothetical protein